ncbi:unnamed protein product, partial [Staurois parvus]
MLSLVCTASDFSFSWEGACDRHRANQHYLDTEGKGLCNLIGQ